MKVEPTEWKKLSIISVLATSPLAMFAYYDDYSSSSSGWLTFLIIILLVWGILEVILFYSLKYGE